MTKAFRVLGTFALLLSASAWAVTYSVPADRDLVLRTELIAVMTAIESHAELRDADQIVTVTTLRFENVLKGNHRERGETLQIVHPGGSAGSRISIIPGVPRFRDGARYLLFLERKAGGEWTTFGWGLGKFTFVSDFRGRTFVVRDEEIVGFTEGTWQPHTETIRAANEFMDYIAAVNAAGRIVRDEDYHVRKGEVLVPDVLEPQRVRIPATDAARRDFLFGPSRWQNGGRTTMVYCCSNTLPAAPLNAPNAFGAALNNWNGTGTSVNYTNGGLNDTANKGLAGLPPGTADGRNAVLFGDPGNSLPNQAFSVGGISASGSAYSLDGESFVDIVEVDVIMGRNAATDQNTFIGLVTHEIGHTLGLRHSNQVGNSGLNAPACSPPSSTCTSDAIMNSTVPFGQSTLRQWDRDAIQTVYGSGPVCTAASFTTQPSPASQTITAGQTATVTATVAGTAPITLQWFTGTPQAPGPAISGATAATLQFQPATSTTVFLRATNCGSTVVNSNTASITVNAATCPTVTATATANGNTLTASASGGSGFTFSWFQGTPPSGIFISGGQSITVTPTVATTYYVRATNSCGNSADSNTVTVQPSTCPAVTVTTPTVTTVSGGFQLATTATGGTIQSIQWFRGTPPSGAFEGGGNTIVVNPSTPTSYFARADNTCGNFAFSAAVTVTPGAACTPPAVSSVTATPASISAGQTATLSVNASGTSISFQWFEGQSGDTTKPVAGGTTATITVTPTATTSYWVRVSSGCGANPANSNTVTVAVSGTCAPPTLVQPANQTVVAGIATSITISATGTGNTFQWFKGTKGDTSSPVGTNSATLLTGPITSNAQFWVRVTSSCGAAADSETITINTVVGRRRASRRG